MDTDLLTWSQRGRLWVRLGIRAALAVGAVLLLVFVVAPLVSLMMPFVLALILAWLLNPLVRWLKKKLPLSRKAISLILLLLVFGCIGGLLYALGHALVVQVISLFENWRPILNSVLNTIDNVGEWLHGLSGMLPAGTAATGEELAAKLAEWIGGLDLSGYISAAAGRATGMLSGLPGFAVATVVFLMGSYFITSDYPRLRGLVTEQIPGNMRAFCGEVRRIFMEAFGGYLKGELLLSLGVFLILLAGFLLTRQPYGLVLAFVLAVMDFIPIIGSGTAMVPWAVIDLILGNYRHAVGFVVIWGVVALFRRLAEPKVLSGQMGLSPILSLIGIYVGMKVGGVLGMVVGPLLLLVCINLTKLGIFRPVAWDIRLAALDVAALLREGRPSESGGGADGSGDQKQ